MSRPILKRRGKKNILSRIKRSKLWKYLEPVNAILGPLGFVIGLIGLAFAIYTSNSTNYVPVITGVITPSNEPNIQSNSHCVIPANVAKLYLGSNVFYWEHAQKSIAVLFYGQNLITINIKPEGLSINATIYREDGRLVAQITDNKFVINPNQYFQLRSRDQHELRVEGKDSTLLLYVRYLNEKTFLFEGILAVPGKRALTVTQNYISDDQNDHFSNNCYLNSDLNHIINTDTKNDFSFLQIVGQ
jgi:hypothetical protein